jgi:hypothetical protein
MVDPLQRTSSVPLPDSQTQQSVHNPLPLDSPKELKRVEEDVKQSDADKKRDNFEDYLDQAGITTLEKAQAGRRFDPVSEITAESVYTQPNDKTQF